MLAMLKRISAQLSNSYARRIIDDVKSNKDNSRCQIKEIKLSDQRPIECFLYEGRMFTVLVRYYNENSNK